VSMYKEEPIKRHFLKDTTEFYIIGGQHKVEAHKTLVGNNEISEADQAKASRFNVIPLWCASMEKTKLLMLSRILNQELAGAQKEQSFMQQLVHARLKWTEMGEPQPAIQGRQHSPEFQVSPSTW
jgi:hypothetical protein